MKRNVCCAAILAGVIAYGAVNARSITYDEPNFDLSPSDAPFTTLNSASLALTGYSLFFAPGVTGANFSSGPAYSNGTASPYSPQGTYQPIFTIDGAYMFNWGSNPVSQNPGDVVEQVIVYHPVDGSTVDGSSWLTAPSSSNGLEIDFNYFSGSCAGQTASLMVNGTTYTDTSNPCSSGTNAFFLNDGAVVSVPTGWMPAATAAPEIDVNSAFSSVTLLFGALAVLRRRSPAVRSA